MIAKNSSKIIFLKLEEDKASKKGVRWHTYHTLNFRGFIYTIKGNKTVFISTEKYIYFYLIGADDIPVVENVIYNFLNCTSVVAGALGQRQMLSYKMNEKGFTVLKRRYFHHFKLPLAFYNYEGCSGI